MAPRPLPQSWSLPSPCNGTTSTPPKLVTLPLNHSTLNGTLRWHPAIGPPPCSGTLVPRPIRQSGSSPSPLLEVRTPIAIAIWGIKHEWTYVYIYIHRKSTIYPISPTTKSRLPGGSLQQTDPKTDRDHMLCFQARAAPAHAAVA